jgi:hypothetical protein
MQQTIPSLDQLIAANSNKFSKADYINFVLYLADSPKDVILSFSEVFFPKFVEYDKMPFNVSFGCYDTYVSNVNRSMSKRDAYYWSNVIDVGETFRICNENAKDIAEKMCIGWNFAIKTAGFYGVEFVTQVEDDEILIFANITWTT